MQKDDLINLTAGKRLTKNTLWNLLGGTLPLLVGVVTIPLLVKGLGTDRFGVLALAWMVVGYFSLFDLGLGRVLTLLVAEKLGADQSRDIPPLVWTALFLMGCLGLIGALMLAVLSSWLVYSVLKIPDPLQAETLNSFYLLAISVPAIISTAGLRGLLESYQRFDLTNLIRIPMGLFIFLGPLAVLPFSNNLCPVVAVLVAGRFIAWGVYLFLCLRLVPELRYRVNISRVMLRPLISFGGWMSVTSILGPVMLYVDRFLIGALLSMAYVAYYTTPYEVVTKLLYVPCAFVGVMFPAFSTSLVQGRNWAAHLFGRGLNYVFLAIFPLTIIITTLSHEGLEFWLGIHFAQNSTSVLQWLAVGVFVNSLAQIPFSLIQGAGRPDITAKLHIIELPFYLLTVWWLTITYGIEGTAIAWVLRVAVDAIALFAITPRLLPATAPAIRHIIVFSGAALFFMVLSVLTSGLIMKVLFLGGVMIIFVPVAWYLILTVEERGLVCNRIKGISILF